MTDKRANLVTSQRDRSDMEIIPESQPGDAHVPLSDKAPKSSQTLSEQEIGKPSGSEETLLELCLASPPEVLKGKDILHSDEELISDFVSFKISGESIEEIGSASSFSGASHPPEPADTDSMMPVYLPIGQTDGDGKCATIFVEEPNNSAAMVSSLFAGHGSLDIKEVGPSQDVEEKECRLDASFHQSGNVTSHSSIDSIVAMAISTKGSFRGESLESTKTSISQVSNSSCNFSDDSNWSCTTGSANKPHKGNDQRWKAILGIQARDGVFGISNFRLQRRVGRGDIGSVYLSELTGTQCFFAMKVTDKETLASKKKLTRAQMEREILQLLDHPFLPTLYAHFETDRFLCLVMEYCPGGDLHKLRHQQPGKCFSEHAARFYAAEVLLALEYLHMLGVVYRDLKPENVLIREDGQIMLSDFDLSFRCEVSPTVMRSSLFDSDPSKGGSAFYMRPSSVEPEPTPGCIKPGCFFPRIFPQRSKKKSENTRAEIQPGMLVVEPTAARSMSFVGTHEYLAPEIIKGEGHGSAVDWWTLGIFLYELLYGKTPFKGSTNRVTVYNVVGQQLKFPDLPVTSYASRDLIRGLLVKDPKQRLGVKKGAAEIKQHPFFQGVNWALIRCGTPPDVPKLGGDEAPGNEGTAARAAADMESGGKYLDFEFF